MDSDWCSSDPVLTETGWWFLKGLGSEGVDSGCEWTGAPSDWTVTHTGTDSVALALVFMKVGPSGIVSSQFGLEIQFPLKVECLVISDSGSSLSCPDIWTLAGGCCGIFEGALCSWRGWIHGVSSSKTWHPSLRLCVCVPRVGLPVPVYGAENTGWWYCTSVGSFCSAACSRSSSTCVVVICPTGSLFTLPPSDRSANTDFRPSSNTFRPLSWMEFGFIVAVETTWLLPVCWSCSTLISIAKVAVKEKTFKFQDLTHKTLKRNNPWTSDWGLFETVREWLRRDLQAAVKVNGGAPPPILASRIIYFAEMFCWPNEAKSFLEHSGRVRLISFRGSATPVILILKNSAPLVAHLSVF